MLQAVIGAARLWFQEDCSQPESDIDLIDHEQLATTAMSDPSA